MRGLKILVTVMGVMLAAGMVVLVVAIGARLSHRAPAVPSAAFIAPPITLLHGSKIETMSTGTDRIVLQVDLADGSVELVVIDLATGRLVGVTPLHEE
jgi:hypothetical protein